MSQKKNRNDSEGSQSDGDQLTAELPIAGKLLEKKNQ